MNKNTPHASLSQREDEILDAFKEESIKNGDGEIAPDGLIFMGELFCDEGGNWIRNRGDEVSKWDEDSVKLAILTKEQNEPDDYYDIRSASGFAKGDRPKATKFYRNIGAILYGLRTLSPDYPGRSQVTLMNVPYVRINLKKQTAGGQESRNYSTIVLKYQELTKRQLSIYGAKIYFNGGGKMGMKILQDLYPDITYFQTSADSSIFNKQQWNRWIWYSERHQIVVINGYHPSYFAISEEDYYNSFMTPYLEFISKWK